MSPWTFDRALSALKRAGFRHYPGSSALFDPTTAMTVPYAQVQRDPETMGEMALDLLSRQRKERAA